MSKIVRRNLPCFSCSSSDARQEYENGTSYCFSCNRFFKDAQESDKGSMRSLKTAQEPVRVDGGNQRFMGIPDRKICKEICEFYGVTMTFSQDGEVEAHNYPYGSGSWKHRKLPKEFSWTSSTQDLFGADKFNSGGKRLIICEGEIDTLSVAQASYERYGKMYPVVGLSSSSMANKSIMHRLAWIKSFGEVVLVFDEDEAGEKARKEAIRILGVETTRITRLPLNDANDVLVKMSARALMECVFDAAVVIPDSIVDTSTLWQKVMDRGNTKSVPYPPCLEGLNRKLLGMRPHEITLFVAGTSVGKSSALREIMLHLLDTTDEKIGIVSLEETPQETARILSYMSINKNPSLCEVSPEQLKVGFDKVYKSDRVVMLDQTGSLSDISIIRTMEYMCLKGCTKIFIDHLTLLVAEGVEGLQGLEAVDKVMGDLLKFVKRFPVWIGLVNHLRKVGEGNKGYEEGAMPSLDSIKGSGSIKQISFDVVAFARDLKSPHDSSRSHMKVCVLKARFTGNTGMTGGCRHDNETGRLSYEENDPMEVMEFTSI